MAKFAQYWYTFKNSWQTELEYRLNTAVRFLITTISLVSAFYLWNYIYADRAVILGYSKAEMVSYYVFVAYIFSSLYAWLPVSYDIREGYLSTYLTKPTSYLWTIYCETLSKRLFRLIVGLPVILLVVVLLRNHLYIPTDWRAYGVLMLTYFGALNVMFLVSLFIHLLEFRLMYADNLEMILDGAVMLLGGVLIPVNFLPSALQTVSAYLPFQYTSGFLINSFLGRVGWMEILQGIGYQMAWTAVLSFIVWVSFRSGLKKYEASGG